jgi:MFS superfamily sulfate permease-like transporter
LEGTAMTRYLPHGATATWALVIFTVWMVIMWASTGSIVPMILWFIGLAIVVVLWLASRPRQNVHIYGPNGKEWVVTAATAERRVRDGWTYEPQAARP